MFLHPGHIRELFMINDCINRILGLCVQWPVIIIIEFVNQTTLAKITGKTQLKITNGDEFRYPTFFVEIQWIIDLDFTKVIIIDILENQKNDLCHQVDLYGSLHEL